ncbi:MAG: cupin domain-containing protein [Pseudomonadota bacterium]
MRALLLTAALLVPVAAFAQDDFTGPRQGRGISNETLGLIPLGQYIESHEDRTMRMRYWEVEPGGVVPLHSHANRPSMIYIMEGTIVEHRSDLDEPKVYGPGGVSIEAGPVLHWWENTGDVTVKMIAFDVFQDQM